MKQWIIENIFQGRARFMSFIGTVFVCMYLVVTFYQISYWNIYMSKGKMTLEIYERMVTGSLQNLFSIIIMIVAFYFRSDEKKEEQKQQP